jgi:hypothetical protein
MLGNDTELEVQLRQQVVDEFCKRHLKVLVQEASLRQLSADVHTEIMKELREQVGSLDWHWRHGASGYTANINARVKEIIVKAVEQEAGAAVAIIRDKLSKELEEQSSMRVTRWEQKLMAVVMEKVNSTLAVIDGKAEQLLNEAFERRVQSEVARRIRLAATAVDTPHA